MYAHICVYMYVFIYVILYVMYVYVDVFNLDRLQVFEYVLIVDLRRTILFL